MQSALSSRPRLTACRSIQSATLFCRSRPHLPSRRSFSDGRQVIRRCAEPEVEDPDVVEFKSEEELKAERSEALRQAEKFMIVGEGNATCSSCGYLYEVAKGDPSFPIPKGTKFQDTPDDYRCPLCGAPKEKFRSSAKTIAGFAVNQGYGFGTNTMTGGQKQLLIFGTLFVFFILFIAGYFLD